MRIIHIDNYDVCEENGKFLAASFKDYEGISHEIEITDELEEYFREVRKEEFKENWETRFHIDIGINNDEEVFEIAQSFSEVFDHGDFNEIRSVIESLISYIELDNDDVTIHWKFS